MIRRQNGLKTIYACYEQWTREFSFACEKGCATCCTQSVTMTTLEGELIFEYLLAEKPEILSRLEMPVSTSAPALTTNQFAAACLKGEGADEGRIYWNLAPCIFLQDSCCTIYPARPFMCRSFGSMTRCEESGEAEIEPIFLTLNTLIMQCIEHLDQGRPWGNMNVILQSVLDSSGDAPQKSHPRLFAEPIPGFLLLPDEITLLQDHIQTLMGILREAARTEKKLQ